MFQKLFSLLAVRYSNFLKLTRQFFGHKFKFFKDVLSIFNFFVGTQHFQNFFEIITTEFPLCTAAVQ